MSIKTRRPSIEPATTVGRTTVGEATTSRRGSRRTTTPQPEGGSEAITPSAKACGCGCGAQVKGQYRPGHDARHVSAQADLFVAATSDGRVEILDRLEQDLSPALMAKWQARVARLTARDQIAYQARSRTSKSNPIAENPKEN